ncbi:hypothetical protein AXF42_Ash005345 [Apostasia shenzhenica]|uniref:DUF4283 domain-containing protein n=1 Tax=Apostasia shenzhenica TaxID=1088818 RepID=A0A2I0B6P6_9ASPA|nr:hypothetical protein AXF42_Ash005345 [Apostasia shenzhenica]
MGNPPISFAAAVSSCAVSPSLISVNKQPYYDKDAISFSYSSDDIKKLASPFDLSLVGKFLYGRPYLADIRRFFISLNLKGGCNFGLMDNRHLFINFLDSSDYHRLWEKQVYYVEKCPMKLSKWYPGFRVEKESFIFPVWINFPRIPVEFRGEAMNWASIYGKPIKLDEATSKFLKPCFAQVLVKMDVNKKHKEGFLVDVDGKDKFFQKVMIENMPTYCNHCFKLGHNAESCFLKNPLLRKEKNSGLSEKKDKGFHLQKNFSKEKDDTYKKLSDLDEEGFQMIKKKKTWVKKNSLPGLEVFSGNNANQSTLELNSDLQNIEDDKQNLKQQQVDNVIVENLSMISEIGKEVKEADCLFDKEDSLSNGLLECSNSFSALDLDNLDEDLMEAETKHLKYKRNYNRKDCSHNYSSENDEKSQYKDGQRAIMAKLYSE